MMQHYNDLINELNSNDLVRKDTEIYDYQEMPLSEEFENFYTFCQELLDREDRGYNITPARIYFSTFTGINACAFDKNGWNLVEIYKGSIFHLHKLFSDKTLMFNSPFLGQYQDLCTQRGIFPSYFLFQFVTLFFIYHETGHLIQRQPGEMDSIEFISDNCVGNIVPEKHARELDADWFSLSEIAMHAIKFNQTGNTNDLEKIASLALAGIFIFFIDRANSTPQIYYEERCHPHPYIRFTYSVNFLLDAIESNTNIEFDKRKVLLDAILISQELMQEGENNIVREMALSLQSELNNIEEYIKQILRNVAAFPYMCMNRLGI